MAHNISNIIFQSPVIDLSHNFSSAEEIDSFFASVPPQARKKWPLDFRQAGLKTKYLSVKVHPETWKEEAYCNIQAEVYNNKHSIIIEQQIRFGDYGNCIINLESIHSSKSDDSPEHLGIAHLWNKNNFMFLLAYDKENKPKESSYMSIHASSELTKQNVRTCGGYVWANNGFKFRDKQELDETRNAFRDFMKQYDILLSDKNLKLFTKPCHFAAYECGFPISFNGKFYHAGKVFLLQHSWFGIQKASEKNSLERRYSHCYYEEPSSDLRRKKLSLILGKKFTTFLDNTHKKTVIRRASEQFKSFRKILSLQKIKHFFR